MMVQCGLRFGGEEQNLEMQCVVDECLEDVWGPDLGTTTTILGRASATCGE